MAVAVWTWEYDYPEEIERVFDEVTIPMAPGEEILVSRDIAHTHATGYGTSASYTGQNVFRISVNRANYDGDEEFRSILAFLQARKDDQAAFYFYNILENAVPSTWTGDTSSGPATDPAGNSCTNTTGRYLVRVFGNLKWTLSQKKLVGVQVELREAF